MSVSWYVAEEDLLEAGALRAGDDFAGDLARAGGGVRAGDDLAGDLERRERVATMLAAISS